MAMDLRVKSNIKTSKKGHHRSCLGNNKQKSILLEKIKNSLNSSLLGRLKNWTLDCYSYAVVFKSLKVKMRSELTSKKANWMNQDWSKGKTKGRSSKAF